MAWIWRAKTGTPWRDLPEGYGKWKTVYSRWLRWRDGGVWQRVWEALQQEADRKGEAEWEIHFIDSMIVRAHQHAAGAKKAPRNGRLRAQSWWADDESPCTCGWERTPIHVCAHTRSTTRCHDGRDVNAARGDFIGQAGSSAPSTATVGSGQSLRVAPVQASFAAARHSAHHPA